MQTIADREPMHGDLGRFYDAIENPRRTRGELPILRDAELRSYMADVRERTLEVLDSVEVGAGGRETRCCAKASSTRCCSPTSSSTTRRCCSCCRWSTATSCRRPTPPRSSRRRTGPETVTIEGGEHEIGAPSRGFAYDNERRRHAVELAAFEIDRTPVTNAAYIEFMEETGAEAPMYWERDGEAAGSAPRWVRTRRSTPASPSSTSPGTRPTPSPAGPASGCRASTSGRPRARTCEGVGGPGSGPPRTSSPIPASRPSPTRSTPRSSSAPSTRCCAAPPGRPTRDVVRPSFRNWDLPQRQPDLRRPALREGRS